MLSSQEQRGRIKSVIVDAHYHLEEELETVEVLMVQMQKNNIVRVALIPRINEPFHLKPIPKMAGNLLPRLLMSRLRFLGLILYNSTVTSDGKLSTLGIKYDLFHKPDNTYIDRILQKYPDKFFGWIFVNPKTMDPLEEVERWVSRQGWIGVKTHPFWHSYPVAMLDEVAALCVEKNLPILMHLGADQESGDYRYLPERHPKLRIIYAHAAVPRFREIWDYAKKNRNIFVDLSSPVYMNEGILSRVVETLGKDKCIYGTDGPYANATQGRMLDRFLRLPLSGDDRERILSGNFIELIETQIQME